MLTIRRAKSGSSYASRITRRFASATISAGSVSSSMLVMIAEARSDRLSVMTACQKCSLESK